VTIELLLAIGLGVLTAAGVWLLLRARVFDIIVGLTCCRTRSTSSSS